MSIKQQSIRWLAYIGVLAVAGFAGFYVQQTLHGDAADGDAQAVLSGTPPFSLPGLDGRPVESTQFAGKVMVVNFWATWCPPCLREIPLFVELQKEYGDRGLQFVGIAIDTPDKVRQFAGEHPFNYPIGLATTGGTQLSLAFGNVLGGLPYTAVVDRDGKIVFAQTGELTRAKAEERILPLL